jgi:hypothetical protein
MAFRNLTKSVVSQCQVVVFPYVNQVISETATIDETMKTTTLDVSPYLTNCNFSKTLSSPSGSFSFSLAPSQDWKAMIKPGTWCLIYMSQDGDLKISNPGDAQLLPTDLLKQKAKCRGICYIERVALRNDLNETGTVEYSYEFSGRDFGIIYDETNIWHDYFQFDKTFFDSLSALVNVNANPTVDTLIETIHNLFFSPKRLASLASNSNLDVKNNSVLQVGSQWILPESMLSALGLDTVDGQNENYYGNIKGLLDNLQSVKANYPVENVLSLLTGNAWTQLRAYSVEQFHELYPELSDQSVPQLNFRPIPWKTNPTGYPSIEGSINSMIDLIPFSGVELNTQDIFSYEIGEDDHSRYNHFYLSLQLANLDSNSNIALLRNNPSAANRTFPYGETNSIARHGFRPHHTTVNSLYNLSKGATADPKLLVEYNEVLFDYFNNAVFYENGTLSQIGRNDVRLGKVITFDSQMPYLVNRIFYLEAYSDEFSVDDKGVGSWNQTLTLTRGTDLQKLKDQLNKNSNNDLNLSEEVTEDLGTFVKKN